MPPAVTGIEDVVSALAEKGVEFEHFPDIPETTLEGVVHVWEGEKAAWFKDPDGSTLCLHERD